MTRGVHRPVAETRAPEQIRADIERTRIDLAETVAALAGRADVKARARRAANSTLIRIRDRVRRNAVPAALTVAAALFVLSVVLRHRAQAGKE